MNHDESLRRQREVQPRSVETQPATDSVAESIGRRGASSRQFFHPIHDLIGFAETASRGAVPFSCGVGAGFVRSSVDVKPLSEKDLRTAFPLLASLPHPVLWIGDDHAVNWSNPVARQVYAPTSDKCHVVCHGYQAPCHLHGEPCPMRVATAIGTAVSVAHVHQAGATTKFFEVTAIPVIGGGIIEIHIPVEDFFAVDALTGTHTRAFFEQSTRRDLALMQRIRKPYALVMLDLDHFKRLNDEHGHPAGDLVLQAIGGAIMDNIRGTDSAGRWGGEEFCVFLPGIDANGAIRQVRRVQKAIRSLGVKYNATMLSATASFGIHSSSSAYNFNQAVRWADIALYRAKNLGRDRIVLG